VRLSDTIGPMESLAIKRVKLLQKEFNEEVEKIIGLLMITDSLAILCFNFG
jgi:hypothetical protein